MSKQYKIAIVGNKETIIGFKALGLKTFNANSSDQAIEILYKLKEEKIINEKTGEENPMYAIIFVIEELIMNIGKEDYKKLNADALPAIIPLPGSKGATGYGIKRIGKMVEQAVGSDIFQ